MPFMDGSGPMGKGPKTGRGLGRCAETTSNSFGFGRGFGRGRGYGLGWKRSMANQTPNKSTPNLTQYKNELEAELNRINNILNDEE